MQKVSLQMIADSLGVSKATVSLVLNGKSENKRVSEELCAKVLAKAKELNYHPNELARGLRTGKTRTIGVIVADISNEFFGSFAYYIQKRSQKHNYSVITTNMDESCDQFKEMSTLLINRQVDGIIAVPAYGCEQILKRVVDRGIPMVQIDRFFPEVDASYVVLDNYGASYKTVGHLYDLGCRKIALIKHGNDVSVNLTRTAGFVDAMKSRGIYDESLVKRISYKKEEEDIRCAVEDLVSGGKKVDAVLFASHELFITGVKYLHLLKVRIPEDIRVACFDKVEVFSILDFPLIYVEQPVKEMADRAVDILMSQIQGSEVKEKCMFDGKVCTWGGECRNL